MLLIYKYKLILLALIVNANILLSQNTFQLIVINTDNSNTFKNLNYKTTFKDSVSLKTELKQLLSSLHNSSYLLANIDSSEQQNKKFVAYLSIGKSFNWAYLKSGNADKSMLSEIGFSEKFYTNAKFSARSITKLQEKIISYYENHGYPFASIKLDSLKISENSFSAKLNISPNKKIIIDSIINIGNAIVSKNFLQHYLAIKEGRYYKEDALKKAEQKLNQLAFVSQAKSPIVKINSDQCKMYLNLNKKSSSNFDGIIGLLPSPNGKTVFTGDLKIKLLNNIFKSGETFDLQWRRLQSQTQDLKLNLQYPYLFNTPFGTDYTIKIYKRDTTFIDIQNNIGIQYFLSGLNNIKFFYKQRTSNLLSTSAIKFATTLPDYADVRTNSYGLALFTEKLNYKFNPRKGYSINISANVGTRKIKRNPQLNEIVYNGVDLQSNQYQGEGNLSFYLPIFKKSTIKLASNFGTVYSKKIFKNELFRLGGLKSFRGVDEESIFASTYINPSLEYRFLFEQNSSINLFADALSYENNSTSNYIKDFAYSFGAGISFETKAGIFSLNYALASQFSNPIDIRSGKIHFGIVNTF